MSFSSGCSRASETTNGWREIEAFYREHDNVWIEGSVDHAGTRAAPAAVVHPLVALCAAGPWTARFAPDLERFGDGVVELHRRALPRLAARHR